MLVMLAVIGFPLLFDTQPRPVAVNAPITIPDKDKVPPLRAPAAAPNQGARVSDAASLGDREEVVTSPPSNSRNQAAGAVAPARVTEGRAPAASRPAEAAREARTDTKPEPKPENRADSRAAEDAARARREEEARAKREEAEARVQRDAEAKAKRDEEAKAKREEAEAKAKAKREEAARARAILEGRTKAAAAADAASDQGRFIIQVGAFAEDSAAREARQKAERAGVKTYTQVVDTKEGKRTRVRVGPFSSRADAEKAAAALKKAGLGGSILSL